MAKAALSDGPQIQSGVKPLSNSNYSLSTPNSSTHPLPTPPLLTHPLLHFVHPLLLLALLVGREGVEALAPTAVSQATPNRKRNGRQDDRANDD